MRLTCLWALTLATLLSFALPSHGGLLHWFSLQMSYSDSLNSSVQLAFRGSGLCANFFQVPPAPSAWTQICAPLQIPAPATLAIPAPTESLDVSLSVYALFYGFSQQSTFLFSCDGAEAGAVDCLELWYDSTYSLVAGRLNAQGNGGGQIAPLPIRQWTHVAATYSNASGLFSVYVAGALVNNFTVAHSAGVFGAPVLGGQGSNPYTPAYASFVNWRQYDSVLTADQVAQLAVIDAPGYVANSAVGPAASTATPSTAAPAASPTSAPMAAPTSAPVPATSAPVAPAPNAVFMLAGQSNMVGLNTDGSAPGTTTLYDLPQITQLGRWTSGGYSATGNDNMQIVQGMDPLEFDNSAVLGFPGASNVTTGIGPGMSFAYSYVQGTGQSVTLVPCAVASTGFPLWSPGQSLYLDCLIRTQAALAAPGRFFAGVLWSQGEANSDGSYTSALYTAAVQAMVTAFRTALAAYPGTPTSVLIADQMRPAWVAATSAVGAPAIQAAIDLLPTSVSRAAVVYGLDHTGASLPAGSGDSHYSAGAQRYLGSVMYTAYQAALQNFAGSLVPGVIVQLFVAPVNNRAEQGFSWTPDPIAVAYELTVLTPGAAPSVFNVSQASFATAAFLNPNVTYTAFVQGVGPTGALGLASVPVTFQGVLPYSYYTQGYPTFGIRPYTWLVADTILSSLAMGESITTWEDVSGNGHSFSQLASASQPYVASGAAGHAGVVFNDSFLASAPVRLPNQLTFVFVLSVTSLTPASGQLSAFLGTNLFALFVAGVDGREVVQQLDFPNYGVVAASNLTNGALPVNGQPVIVSVVYLSDVLGALSQTVLYVNGQLGGTGVGPLLNQTAVSSIQVGSTTLGGSAFPFFGQVSEVLIYNQAIPDITRQLAESYLSTKYGIALPSVLG